MITVQQQFLQIISDYLHNRETTLSIDESSIDELLSLTKSHELEGIVYKQTRLSCLHNKYMYALYIYNNRILEVENICNLFINAGIEYFIIKGPIVSNYYPDPFLRTMGDVDFVVKDREKAIDILKDNGYSFKEEKWSNEKSFSKNELNFELHNRLLYDQNMNETLLKDYFDKCWDYVSNNKLDINYHYLFMIVHLRKHFLYEGVGIRQFIDLAVLYKQDLNWEWIQEQLEILKIDKFTRTCLSLIERWFDIPSPIETVSLTDDFYQEATNKILNNGVFGYDDQSNHYADMTNDYRSLKTNNKLLFKLDVIKRSIFPSYHVMKNVSHYSFVDGHPLLMPVAWIYRWGYVLKNKNSNISVLAQDLSDEGNKKMQKRLEMFQKWGI